MLEVTTGLGEHAASPFIAAAPDAKFVLIPDAALLFTADFKKAGPDLVLTGDDGRHAVVIDYFNTDAPVPLVAPNGASLSPDVITLLAGSHAHAQYAQADAAPPPPAPIGAVKTLIGNVSVIRNGVELTLRVGDPVYKSDVVQTASGSAVGIAFPDGTALHITANARMALSDYNFEVDGTTNGAVFHLVDGTFSFVAGQVAMTGGLKIETPIGNVGIRGTTGWVQKVATVSATFGNATYSFAVTEDQGTHHTGIYDVIDQYGNVFTVSEKGILTTMTGQGVGQPPLVTTGPMTAEQLAFEQQIVQGVFNALAGPDAGPRFDSGHDGTYQPPPPVQHNEIPGDPSTTFALTVPGPAGPVTGTVTVVFVRPVLAVQIDAINHSPTLDPASLADVLANARHPAGQTVGTIFGGKFHDVDANASLAGIAIAGNAANPVTQGVWQYSLNGSVWIDIGAVSPSAALVLSADTLIRFVPVRNFTGDPAPLSVYGIDNSYTGDFTGLAQIAIDATSGDDASPVSAAPVELGTSVDENVWIHTAGGDWSTAGNWSGGVPGHHELVVIDLPAGQTVNFDGNGSTTTATIGRLTNIGGGTLEVSDSAILKVRGAVTNAGGIEAGQDGEVSFRRARVDNQHGATIDANGSGSLVEVSQSSVRNTGLMAAYAQGLMTLDHVMLANRSAGVVVADGRWSEIDFCHGSVTNEGFVEARHGGEVSFDHVTVHNTVDGDIEATGRRSEIDFRHGSVTNEGVVEARYGGEVSFDHVTVYNTINGDIEANGHRSEIDFRHGSVTNEGFVEARHGGDVSFEHVTVENTVDGEIEANGHRSEIDFRHGSVTNEGFIEARHGGEVSFDHVTVDNTIDGDIEANGHRSEIDFRHGSVTNEGFIEARHGGEVSFDHTFLRNRIDGVIQADGRGSEIDFSHSFVTSAGLIEAKHGAAMLFDHVILHNGALGTIDATGCGSEIDFIGGTVANGGLIGASWGGLVSFGGGSIDNTHGGADDGVIQAAGAGAVVEFYDAHVIGGTLQAFDGGVFQVESGNAAGGTVFDGSQTDCNGCALAITIDGHVIVSESSELTLLGSIDNQGRIEVDPLSGSGSQLVIGGEVALSGGGSVQLDGSSDSIVGSFDASCNVLTNVDNTIFGAGSIGNGCADDLKLINQSDGVVDANVAGATLTIDTGWHHVTNAGVLEATDGGTLVIDSAVDNACGLVEADCGSSLVVGADICGGDALIKGGTLEYDGSSDVSTTFAARTDGTLVLGACSDFTGHVCGFDSGDVLDFAGIDFSCRTDVFYCGADGTLTVCDGWQSSTIQLDGNYDGIGFTVSDDGSGHAAVSTAAEATDDNIIASYSAVDGTSSLYIPTHALLENDLVAYRGDTLTVDGTTDGTFADVTGPDCQGNIRAQFDVPADDHFGYTVEDALGQQSTAGVQVTFQCGSLTGTCGNDIIIPGSESACLTGGGGNDTFLFQGDVSTNHYIITDFTAHSQGGGADTIDLDNFNGIAEISDVLSSAYNSGCNAVIDLGCGNSITLQNVHVADLSSADFAIHHAACV